MGNPTIKPGMSDETGRLIASSINALADAIQAENCAEATQNGSEVPSSGTANLGTTVKPRMSDEAGLSIAGNIDKLTSAVQTGDRTYGSPLKAATAADMTNQKRVYVYTGSEAGYTAGHWYYHNGTSWTDGGVYNAVAVDTDTTLSVSGKAADSKKTGDEISQIKEKLNDAINVISEDKIELQQWERGNINNSTGANANSDRFVRTSNYYDVSNINGMICTLDSGNYNDLIFTVYKYGSNSNYLGYVAHVGGTFDIDLTGVSTVRFLLEITSGDSTTVINPVDGNDLLTVTASVFVKIAMSDDFTHDKPIKLDWERGKISSSGNNSASSSTTHIRTEFRHFIPKNKFRLTIPTGVSVTVYRYTAVTGATFDSIIGTYVASTDILITANSYIRLVAYYTSGADTPLSVGDTIIVSYTETFDEIAEKSNDDELSDFCSLAMFSDIAVLGDSYASGSLHMPNGTYVQNYALSWGQILARRIGATVTNFSDGGLSTETWLTNATYGLSALLADTAKQLYIINFGINDNTQINAGTLSLGSLSDINLTDYTQNPNSFYGNYGRIIGNIKTHAPKALIITLSVARPNERNMDAHIKQIADKCGVPFIQLTDDDYFTSGYFYGSINAGHPLAYGYSGMAAAIQRLIQHHIVSNPSYFYNYDGLTT